MYKFEEIDGTRRDEYNTSVATMPDAHVFQSYEWGEVKAPSWKPRRFLTTRNGTHAGGFQLLERYIGAVRRPVLYVPCGPAGDLADPAFVLAFAAEMKGLAKESKAIYVKVDPPIEESRTDVVQNLRDAGFKSMAEEVGGFGGIQPRCVMHLDISGAEESVLRNMTEKTRYNIRLSSRKGVTVRTGDGDTDLKAFYRILEVTGRRDDFLIRSYSYFKKMYEVMEPRGMLRLFIAEYQEEPIAATIALAFGTRCWYVYGASGNEYRNVMPNHALQWAMIQWARELGCPVYDFRGVPCDLSPGHPLHGLVRFKKGFGAYPVKYIGEYEMTFTPVIAFALKHGLSAYTKSRKLVRR